MGRYFWILCNNTRVALIAESLTMPVVSQPEWLTIQNVMSEVSSTATRDTSLSSIVELMNRTRHSCVVILESEPNKKAKQPLGVITERDIVRVVAKDPSKISTLLAGDVMSSPPVTVLPETPIESALTLARARQLRHILVVDEKRRLIGIVTQTNLVQSFLNQLQHYQREIESAVQDRTEALQAANRELLDLAMEDSLLGIGNRRAMEVDLAFTQSSAARYMEPYYIALLDIDRFKKYNDQYGHQAGDKALQKVTEIIQSQLRDSDRLYRYGGEEFLLLMPKVDDRQAIQIAERCRIAIEMEKMTHVTSDYKVLTTSIGVAEGSDKQWEDSVRTADAALYQAKEQGRNQTVIKHRVD